MTPRPEATCNEKGKNFKNNARICVFSLPRVVWWIQGQGYHRVDARQGTVLGNRSLDLDKWSDLGGLSYSGAEANALGLT